MQIIMLLYCESVKKILDLPKAYRNGAKDKEEYAQHLGHMRSQHDDMVLQEERLFQLDQFPDPLVERTA